MQLIARQNNLSQKRGCSLKRSAGLTDRDGTRLLVVVHSIARIVCQIEILGNRP